MRVARFAVRDGCGANLSSLPPIQDTADADIGILREFRIAGKTWGRYEVWKEWAADPDPSRLAWRNQFYSRDVSIERNQGIPGVAWRNRSVGYVFIKNDASVAFDQKPNQMLGTVMLESELLRLKIATPGEATVSISEGDDLHVNTNGRILGHSKAGVFYPSGSGTPVTGPANQNRVTGTPRLSPSGGYAGSVEDVFGVTLAELKGMAHQYIIEGLTPTRYTAAAATDRPSQRIQAVLNFTSMVAGSLTPRNSGRSVRLPVPMMSSFASTHTQRIPSSSTCSIRTSFGCTPRPVPPNWNSSSDRRCRSRDSLDRRTTFSDIRDSTQLPS